MDAQQIARGLIEAQQHIEAARYALFRLYANMPHNHPLYKPIKQRCILLYIDSIPEACNDVCKDGKLYHMDDLIQQAFTGSVNNAH